MWRLEQRGTAETQKQWEAAEETGQNVKERNTKTVKRKKDKAILGLSFVNIQRASSLGAGKKKRENDLTGENNESPPKSPGISSHTE